MSDVWLEEPVDLATSYQSDAITRCVKAQSKWNAQAKIDDAFAQLSYLEQASERVLQAHKDKHDALNALLDHFYNQWSFSCTVQDVPEYHLNSVYYALRYRTGNSLSLAIVLNALLQHSEFHSELVVINQAVMVQVHFSDAEYYLLDAATGQQSWFIETENDDSTDSDIDVLFDDEVFKLFLAHQKWAFISAGRFSGALACVDLLIDLLGDDPYERRDRGYLLNQINCPELAKEDLRFFVQACPDDPAIDLVRTQIEELDNNNNTLH